MHQNSLLTFQAHALPYFAAGDRVLELAPKGAPSAYIRAVGKPLDLWVTDLRARRRGQNVVVQHDDNTLGCGPGGFDVVLAGNVLEHVWQPWRWVRELARVLKPKGRLILVSPVTWKVHQVRCFRGRRQDGWRVLPDGVRALFEEAGLETKVACLEQLDKNNQAARAAQMLEGDPVDVIGIGVKP